MSLGVDQQSSTPNARQVAPPVHSLSSDPSRCAEAIDIQAAEDRLIQTLLLAEKGLNRLASFGEYWDSTADPYKSVTEKIVVETALLALVAGRVPDATPALRDSLERLMALLCPLARTVEKAALLIMHPHTALPFGIAHVALEKLGLPDPDFSATLRSALSSEHVNAIERLPYRRLEVAWLRALWDGLPLDYDLHMPGSIVNERPHPLHMSTADIYALTHTLFYITDFGRSGLPNDLDVVRLGQCIDACLVWQLFEENVDTVGELLISALVLPTPTSPAATICWDAINCLWAEIGFLPGPSMDTQIFSELSSTERDAYAFQNSYHTMYVAGILNSVVLQRESLRTLRIPVGSTREPLIEVNRRDWPYWVRLAAHEGSGIPAGLAVEAAIIQKGRLGAYADLEDLLSIAPNYHVSSLTIAHAQDLLGRHLAMVQRYRQSTL